MSRPSSPSGSEFERVPSPFPQEVADSISRLKMLEEEIKEAEKRLATVKKQVQLEKFKADISTYHFKGDLHCDNPRHFTQIPYDKSKGGRQVTARPRPPQWIFAEMEPYTKAKCECERRALVYMNKHQYPGTTADQWVVLGSDRKGLGEPTPGKPARKVMPVRYTMNSKQNKVIEKRFPTWTVYTECISTHDHPIAHTTTALASKALFEERLPQRRATDPRLLVLDISGSPRSNAGNAKRLEMDILTTCKVHTGRDEIRRVKKWGPQTESEATEAGNVVHTRWHDLWDREIGAEGSSIPPEKFREVDVITSVHTLYYYSRHEILALLKRGKADLLLEAVVHKFGGENAATGSLNDGEQTWTRTKHADGTATIEQPNTETGQMYSHPDNSWLFSGATEWREGDWVLTWDINKFCDETFFITMKAWHKPNGPLEQSTCKACGHDVMVNNLPEPVKRVAKEGGTIPPPRVQTNTQEWLTRYSTAVLKVGDKYLEYTISPPLHGLFTEARRRLDGKARTMEAYKSHCSLLETKIKRLEAAEKITVSFEAASDLKKASFWMDLGEQLKTDKELFNDHWRDAREGDKLYTYGHHGAERHLVGVAIDAYTQSGAPKGALTGLLQATKAIVTQRT